MMAFADCLLESVAYLVRGDNRHLWINYASNMVYLGFLGGIGYCTLLYCKRRFAKHLLDTPLKFILASVPFFLEIIALCSAPMTHLIFYIDEAGFYHRTSTFFIQFIPYGYLLFSAVVGFRRYFKATSLLEKNRCLSIVYLAVSPIIIGGLQILFPYVLLSTTMFSITFSLFLNFVFSQNNRITRDALTKLPNRAFFDSYVHEEISRKANRDSLYLLICDIDNFKQINDTHGHSYGDRALVLFSNVVSKICTRYKAVPSRIGGDEFAILIKADNKETVKLLIGEINEALEKASRNERFDLHTSIGYAHQSDDSFSDLFQEADRQLYRIKNQNRQSELTDAVAEN
ncbi:MAG: GGDEF domain-containing protein [Clostridia bacterium]|nr:GGDEF domain-containing protein [Clostridia bacterium]